MNSLIEPLNEHVYRLENIIRKSEQGLVTGSWQVKFLNNKETSTECQVAEAYDRDGLEVAMLSHKHLYSKEIFYQIRGCTTFKDGDILNVGEIKIIESGEIHSPSISPGGACIVIIHPTETAYITKKQL